MNTKQKKKEISWQQYIAMVFFVLIGAACGVLMVVYMESMASADRSVGEELFSLCLLFLGMYIAIFLQMTVHEAGHLVFGLMTGYRFSSFRIGSFMWVKEKGKLRFKRLTIAGTGGQCLMAPPDPVDGKIPVALYNLGGSLINVIAGVIFLGLYFLCEEIPLLSMLMLITSVVGFALAVMNGVPMRMGMVDNDGYNALSLGKNHEARRSFWVQMKVNEQISNGIRLRDMPEEWFTVPTDEDMQNSMTAAIGVFACNRLMDEHRFEEAEALMKRLLETDNAIAGLHRSLMICDLIYFELIGENRREKLDEMLDKQQKRFMQSMKKFPSVIRTEYAYALLAEKDTAKADVIKANFEKCARTYPYPSEMDGERELIEIADKSVAAVD